MHSASPELSERKGWKELYLAALVESDKDRILALIDEAEQAIKARATVLLDSFGDHIEEHEAMDDALYALHALKNCLALHGRFAEAA